MRLSNLWKEISYALVVSFSPPLSAYCPVTNKVRYRTVTCYEARGAECSRVGHSSFSGLCPTAAAAAPFACVMKEQLGLSPERT